jgi:hypothetical protein
VSLTPTPKNFVCIPRAPIGKRLANSVGNVGLLWGLFVGNSGFFAVVCSFSVLDARGLRVAETLYLKGLIWSEREDLNLRPLVSQTSALTGLRHAPTV